MSLSIGDVNLLNSDEKWFVVIVIFFLPKMLSLTQCSRQDEQTLEVLKFFFKHKPLVMCLYIGDVKSVSVRKM